MLAYEEWEQSVCDCCGHPKSQCRDPKTAGTWTVVTEVCEPGRIAQAVAQSAAEQNVRGLQIFTRRAEGYG